MWNLIEFFEIIRFDAGIVRLYKAILKCFTVIILMTMTADISEYIETKANCLKDIRLF